MPETSARSCIETTDDGLLLGHECVSRLAQEAVQEFGFHQAQYCWVPGTIACWAKRPSIKPKKGQYHPQINQYPHQIQIIDLEAIITINWNPVDGEWRVHTKGEPDQEVHQRIEGLMAVEGSVWGELWPAWLEDQAQRRRWAYGRGIPGLTKATKKIGPKGELPKERITRGAAPNIPKVPR